MARPRSSAARTTSSSRTEPPGCTAAVAPAAAAAISPSGNGKKASLATALDEDYQGRTATIWAAPLDSEHRIVSDPVIVFKGRMDTMPITMGRSGEITVNLESRLVDWERARVRRYNDADQQAEYPGDLGLQFVEQMVEKQLIWGRA